MKKCNACGSTLNDEVNNCPNCGSNSFTVEMAQQPSPQPVQQPMGQMPMNHQPMMQQQPMMQPGPAVPTGNMPMTYATVYMVFSAISVLGSIGSLLNDFSISGLISVIFSAAVVYFLYKRMKIGRILVMIETVLQAVIGGIFVLLGILCSVGFTALNLGAELAAVGGILGVLLIVFGIGFLAFGICSFIYFKKRACMYTN